MSWRLYGQDCPARHYPWLPWPTRDMRPTYAAFRRDVIAPSGAAMYQRRVSIVTLSQLMGKGAAFPEAKTDMSGQ